MDHHIAEELRNFFHRKRTVQNRLEKQLLQLFFQESCIRYQPGSHFSSHQHNVLPILTISHRRNSTILHINYPLTKNTSNTMSTNPLVEQSESLEISTNVNDTAECLEESGHGDETSEYLGTNIDTDLSGLTLEEGGGVRKDGYVENGAQVVKASASKIHYVLERSNDHIEDLSKGASAVSAP
ncbi:hypothetical protein G7Y89_g8836 [Cudoniella acicularis]|uniref:Uncharacterized protein n=1 Tax=Cudoniella acicularis TaxID=354080 RepID=A0A8H4W082_9HELO|nr:hypothetical protein G7Y89_g8836 [Cudoniella acicularis]